MNPIKHVDTLVKRFPELSGQRENIMEAFHILEESYENGGKLLIAGNGGSAADAEHIVGELMKGFEKSRKLSEEYKERLKAANEKFGGILAKHLQGGLGAIALDGHFALSTAYMNDCEPLLCAAGQWLRQEGRCLFGDIHIWKFKEHPLCIDCRKSKRHEGDWADWSNGQ